MDGGIRFKKLGIESIPALLDLERTCFSLPWNEEQYRVGLEHGAFHAYGAYEAGEGFGDGATDGCLAAYVSFSLAGDEMEILNLATRPELRRRGFARRLLGLALGSCYKIGVRRSFLEVRVSNHPAKALYESLGYRQVGARKGYYVDTGEDALVLRLDLDSPPLLD